MTAPPEVEAAWAQCESDWDNPKRHDALFELASAHECFSFIASKYKPRAGDATADRALERIRKAALAKMMATSTARQDVERKPFRTTFAIVVFLVVLVFVGLAYVTTARNKHVRSLPPPPPTNNAH